MLRQVQVLPTDSEVSSVNTSKFLVLTWYRGESANFMKLFADLAYYVCLFTVIESVEPGRPWLLMPYSLDMKNEISVEYENFINLFRRVLRLGH